jgi:hypothetical protein
MSIVVRAGSPRVNTGRSRIEKGTATIGETGRGYLPGPFGQRLSHFFNSIVSLLSMPVNLNGILSA